MSQNSNLINHEARKRLGLSINQYMVLDVLCAIGATIYPRRVATGFFASELGLSKVEIKRIIWTLIRDGFIDKQSDGGLRVKEKWSNTYGLYFDTDQDLYKLRRSHLEWMYSYQIYLLENNLTHLI